MLACPQTTLCLQEPATCSIGFAFTTPPYLNACSSQRGQPLSCHQGVGVLHTHNHLHNTDGRCTVRHSIYHWIWKQDTAKLRVLYGRMAMPMQPMLPAVPFGRHATILQSQWRCCASSYCCAWERLTHLCHPCVHKGAAAWRCPAIMIAGLKRHVCGGTLGRIASPTQCIHLRMRHACLWVVAFTHYLCFIRRAVIAV